MCDLKRKLNFYKQLRLSMIHRKAAFPDNLKIGKEETC
jgi:hypothetical protein